jgi:DNA-binding response OmpR family regulator
MPSKKIIFIIEKDPELLFVLNLVLKEEYEVYSFTKGDMTFFDLLLKLQPNVVIMEWLTSLLNADEVVQKIRERYDGICKILVTSTRTEVKDLVSNKPVDGFLEKPFRMHELKELIDELIDLGKEYNSR